MDLRVTLVMLVIVVVEGENIPGTRENFPFSIASTLNGTTLTLEWSVDWERRAVDFQALFTGKQPNAVLIGFSDHGLLPKTDFCLYMPRTGQLLDGWIDKRLLLRRDMHQDCELVANQSDSRRLRFSRAFSTCDSRDYNIEPGTTNILFAITYSARRIRGLRAKGVMHEMRHTQLLAHRVPTVTARQQMEAKSLKQLDVFALSVDVPSDVTTYWCAVVELDDELKRGKHHVVKYEPVITKGNENLVHHMEVFHCQAPTTPYNGNCNDGRKPDGAKSCSRVMAAWAMGAEAVVYPDEAGLPIGGEGFVPYLMVEIHYNNVERRSDYVDNSGIRITYTRELRKYDAGIMELGLIYSDANSIPPRQTRFPITGFCLADCTQKFPAKGIYIFASQLHAHLTGRKLWTSHYRNGVKIGEVNRDNHYSPHWQHIQRLPAMVKVLPGDVLTTTCDFDTRERANWTWGGYGIEDEMCVNYIHYYPAARVEVCKSAIGVVCEIGHSNIRRNIMLDDCLDNSTLHAFFAKLGVVNKELSIHEKYLAIEWDKGKVNLLEELYHVAEVNMACLNRSGQLFPSHPTRWARIPRPDLIGLRAEGDVRDECLTMND